MKELQLGKVLAAREILNMMEEIYFSNSWAEYRADKGSNGVRDFLLAWIKEKYDIG